MAKVFVTRAVPGDGLDLLAKAGHDVTVWPGELPPGPDLGPQLRDADAAMTMVTDRIDAAILSQAPKLKIAANMAAGYDNFDRDAGEAAGVWMTNTPGVLQETTADFAFALLLAAARNVVASERDTRDGGWKTWAPTLFLGPDVHGATLGIIGLGEIGQAMARRARGFGMRILYTARSRKPAVEAMLGVEWVTQEELLRQSDFVSLHVPRTPETTYLINRQTLAQMKSTAILINTARGIVVDQDALVEAVRSGQIAGAALDVTDPEPLPLEHTLYSLPNVVITPHIASASTATRARMARMAATNILAVLEGRTPPNPVNRLPQ
ncbi:D-glycerate dehydrogenase [bacterium SCGC AG-212-C10]|nr:D-glycerate dehydrogenase [bacterium SCGC AG-212-C10]